MKDVRHAIDRRMATFLLPAICQNFCSGGHPVPKTYLNNTNVDDLGRMIAALLTECWVMRDRIAVLEQLLEQKIGLSSAEIEAFVPSPAFAEDLQRLRDEMMGHVVGAPAAAEDRSVEAILASIGP